MSRPRRILVTGIGGNTAQGGARSLLKFPEEFMTIGTDFDKYNGDLDLIARRGYISRRTHSTKNTYQSYPR